LSEVLTPRTISLADVALGLLQISVLREAQPAVTVTDPETGNTIVVEEAKPLRLRFKRTYRAIDDAGEVVREVPARDITVDVNWDQLPADVAAGLAAINAYTLRRARIDAGLLEEA
jgi:hypothetical protein